MDNDMKNTYKNKRPSIPTQVARKIKVESGHCCAISNCSEHTYLEIHHIDHNRENNDPANLILLCDKHHKMAHTDIIDRNSMRLYKELLAPESPNSAKPQFEVAGSELKIVDIYQVDSNNSEDREETTIMELKLVNRGSQVAYLKEVKATTLRHWETLTDHHHSLVPISATYDLNIFKEKGVISRVKIHQEIKPQSTERIAFRLGTNYQSDPNGLSLFMINLEVVYNETSRVVIAPPIIVNIHPRFVSGGSYFPGYQLGTIPKNKAVASEILRLASSGTIVSENVTNALKSWAQAPDEIEYFAGLR
jgi:hypothetical protein